MVRCSVRCTVRKGFWLPLASDSDVSVRKRLNFRLKGSIGHVDGDGRGLLHVGGLGLQFGVW